jgi:hypothetical protein
MAEAYALIDENEKALDWLENSITRGFVNYKFLSSIDPYFKQIQDEERFARLMKRAKYESDNFHV